MITESSAVSSDPSLLRGLTEQQQVHLTEILDEYLKQLESGQPAPREEILARYPDLHPQVCDALVLYLDKLQDLYSVADLQPSMSGDLSGKVLGEYRLDHEIGRGGMGIVFAAFEPALHRQVAVKLLPMAAMLEPKYIERFRGEARAAGKLQHPNIVPVYSIGEDAGIHFYAMRLIDGLSLDKRIELHRQRQTHPASGSALLQFADIADALHEAHELSIVHRDIKPSNLLLDHDGKLWVADFGLARCQGVNGLTCTGEMVGTMRYMSPEQASGRSEWVDHRTDVYSLGATLYEFLTGHAAVTGEEGPGLLRAIGSQTPTKLRKLRPDLPRDLQTVLEKAMARHRDDRYATAQEFAADLRRVARGEAISARLVSRLVLAERWMAAHSQFVSFIAAGLLAVAALGATTAYRVHRMIVVAQQRAMENLQMAHALEREREATIDELALLPGAEKIRHRLLQSHLRYYQAFAAQAKEDPYMKTEVARAYQRIGYLNEELGHHRDAISNYGKAELLLSKTVRSDDLQAEQWLDRCRNANHFSMSLYRCGQQARAAELLRHWLNNLRSRRSDLEGDRLVEYGLMENNYGLVLSKDTGKRPEAESALRTAINTLQSSKFAQNAEACRGLAAAMHNLGLLLSEDASMRPQALDLLNNAKRQQQQLVERGKLSLQVSGDLLKTLTSLSTLQSAEDRQGAVQTLEAARELAERLVPISSATGHYRGELALVLSNLGMSYYHVNQSDHAQQLLEESVKHYQQLISEFPSSLSLRTNLAIALNNQGVVLQHAGNALAAENAYRRASALLENRMTREPETLKNIYINYARLLRELGRDSEATSLEEGKLVRLLAKQKDWNVKSES